MLRRGLLLLLLLLAVSACAPRLAPPGPVSSGDAAVLREDALITHDGLALPIRKWLPAQGPPQAVLLALHGFNDYSKAFEEPGEYWAEQGLATYAYDQRGFGAAPHRGLWGGVTNMTTDLRSAIAQLRQRHPGLPLFLVGESMGGAVIMAALREADPLPVDGVVLSAPAVWARETMPLYQQAALWFSAHTMPWARFTGSGLKIQASDNIPMLIELGRDPLVIKETRVDAVYGLANLMDAAYGAGEALTVPGLLLYGEKDEVVPLAPTLDVWKRLPNGIEGEQRAALYEDGWHMLLRDLQAETVLTDIAAWVKNPEAPLPSGADRRAVAKLAEDGKEPRETAER